MESLLFYMFCTWIVLLVMIHASPTKPSCHPEESSALMEFKRSFRIKRLDSHCIYPKIESWSLDESEDCCSWDGVECDKANSHVTGLDLSNSCLFGTISSNTTLFRLLHLESLNLAWNDFNSSSIPYGFGNFSRLRYLNFSYSKISGKVPSDISWLSRLISLDLSYGLYLEMPNIGNFVWNLTVLRELDLSYVNMLSPFPHVLANSSSLKSLKLVGCGLHGEFPVSIFQLPNLEVLDIAQNANLSGFIPELNWGNRLKSLSLQTTNFSGKIPISLGNLVFLSKLSIGYCHFSGSLPTSMNNLSQLAYLDISENKFQGQIFASFANLTQLSTLYLLNNNFSDGNWDWLVNLSKLTHLFLSDVQLSSPIPSSIVNLTQLVFLDLSYNDLEGEIPNSLGELRNLEYLVLIGNNLSGVLKLHKLVNLEVLRLGFNNISLVSKTEMNATLPKLFMLGLHSCNLHEFPEFLGYLSRLIWVNLSNNKIRGSIPTWMWNGSKDTLEWIDLSHNFLTCYSQINLPLPKLIYLDISSNQLKTELPSPPPSVTYYNISNNILFGGIQSICRAKSLIFLDLSDNSLNGTIPSCLGNIDSLSILDLGKNKLGGMIPHAFPKGCALKMIDLTENRLHGPIPRSLVNCTMLEHLNLGYNQILDGFPLWLSELTELKVIILKSNKFHGPIETYRSLFSFSKMHIMDLSYNNFSGELPSKLLQSFHAMQVIISQDRLEYMNAFGSISTSLGIFQGNFNYEMKLINKGIERDYPKIPFALMQIDLSNNKFEGHIPDLIGDLKSLVFLNLSNNVLTGSIPPSLVNLMMLESLDLSRNNLSGEIPQKLARLTFLSSFNVSHNQLSGPIPQGNQFNTFTEDSFAMNEGLYGSPFPNKCTMSWENLPLPPPLEEDVSEESLFNLDWEYVLTGAGVGFVIGVVLGNLIIDEKSRWFKLYSKRMVKGWSRLRRH
ncbi:hypothetical protein ACJRO7_020156 [Eucalyptus globulus]|uniref:Leucine-rich repeat-containing N-terminal plant-type domain-containing protein n=1 Tax=Eucalyptus globulus TaxID=34317 RepID=A0ABD3KLL5_EUCGL